jgi:hypothetical protein
MQKLAILVLMSGIALPLFAAKTPSKRAVTGHDFSRAAKRSKRGRALQAAEKLDFSKSAKNGSRQDALGTIREGWLMVLHPPNSALSPSLRSFSAACLAPATFRAACGLFFDLSPASQAALPPNPNVSSFKCDCSGPSHVASPLNLGNPCPRLLFSRRRVN